MRPLSLSFVVVAVILGGAFAGMLLRTVLPAHHLSGDSKDIVGPGTGLIGTMGALVLGLLIASAKSFYDTQNGEIKQITANLILLDCALALYGPEANEARNLLRNCVPRMIDLIWRGESSGAALMPIVLCRRLNFAALLGLELPDKGSNALAVLSRT